MTHRSTRSPEKSAEDGLAASGAVAVITVNWNGWANSLKCLAALRQSVGASWHLFIVDNGSTDESLTHLRDLGPEVTLIDAGANLGWTGGNNLGVREALQQGYDYIFILNNDAFVEPDTIARLLAASREYPGPAPVLGAIHQGVESHDYDFSHAEIDRKTGIPQWVQNEPASPTPLRETAYVSGAALFARAEHFRTVGCIDDRMFLNFDDTDWCRRALKKGYPLLMVLDAVVHHEGSASIGGRNAPLQTYFMTRNRLLYAEKHATLLQRLRLARRYLWQARDLAQGKGILSLLRADGDNRAAFRQGIIDYLLRRFGDCPPLVRRWQAEATASRRRESSLDAS